MKFPKVTFVLLTLNDEKGVEKCLESVKKQNHPKNKIEIIVIDNDSIDKTREVARRYTKKVLVNHEDPYKNRADAMRMATGDFVFMMLEQDIELKSENFIRDMITPLLQNQNLVASFTRDYPRRDQSWITRFLSYNPIQADPLFEFLTPSLDSTLIEERKDYFIAKFTSEKIPMTTHMFFRTSDLKKTPVWNQEKDFDHETIVKLVKAGYNFFAYVPSAGTYHNHAKDFNQFLSKRIRNLENHYFPFNKTTKFNYVGGKKDVLKLFYWVIYANLVFPATIKGLWKFIKYRDLVLLLEPFVTIAVTDVVLIHFLKKSRGRKILAKWIAKII